MALNYAEKWNRELVPIIIDGTYTSPFVTTNVKWLDAKTFHFTSMSTGGFKNHSRKGGWNRQEYNQQDHPFTITHDRDVEFIVDKADVDETNQTASIKNIANVFVATQQVPETDAYFFEKLADYATKASLTAEKTLADYSPEKVLAQLKADIGQVRRYKNKGLIVYVAPEIMDNLTLSPLIAPTVKTTTISESGRGIETRVATIDGIPVMEIIDTDRFCTKFKYDGETGGFEKDVAGKEILVAMATPLTTMTVPKIESIYSFAPGTHTEGDGYLYQHRAMWDTFVMPNGKDGKVDSVYVVTKQGE